MGGFAKGGGVGVKTDKDPASCGACGTKCQQNEVCTSGKCTSTCPAGTSNCAASCVNLASDPGHCGDCAKSCSGAAHASAICQSSVCALACAAGYGACNGAC